MKERHYWGWPVAGYLFLGGLGGGMVIVSTAADLFFNQGSLFTIGNLVAAILISIGSGLLIFELGRPFRFWRVFSTQRAVMTAGAWMLGILIVTSLFYFLFCLPFFPWSSLAFFRPILAWINLLLGVGVVTYTGILLSSMRARPFWNSPVLPVLFAVSGLSTGTAAQALLAGFWPWQGTSEILFQAHDLLRTLDIGLLVMEALIVMVYVLMMRTSADEEAGNAAARWLAGSMALPFWGGLITLGILTPLILYVFSGPPVAFFAPLCVITGGIFLRFLVVYSDDRKRLPGEIQYFSRLPGPDEPFLHAWF
jgi:protein NrfD